MKQSTIAGLVTILLLLITGTVRAAPPSRGRACINWLFEGELSRRVVEDEPVTAVVTMPVDIKPTSCPNPLNDRKRGVVPVAILGREAFDVTRIDPASVRLAGVPPLRWALEDVSAPFEPFVGKEQVDDCHELGADGYEDLTVKFWAPELVDALGEVEDGQVIVVHLTAQAKEQYGDTPFMGEDVVWILKKGK
jgi:hypothetical protein